MENLVNYVPLICSILIALLVAYAAIRNTSLENVRKSVYDFILRAEKRFIDDKAGAEKFNWVLDKTYELLPAPVRLVVTKRILALFIQRCFNTVKDYLDDGKINASVDGVLYIDPKAGPEAMNLQVASEALEDLLEKGEVTFSVFEIK